MNTYKCDECNKFMSYKDADDSISYTPYGNSNDLDSPDERYFHRECWDKIDEKVKRLIREGSWRKPNEPGAVDLI